VIVGENQSSGELATCSRDRRVRDSADSWPTSEWRRHNASRTSPPPPEAVDIEQKKQRFQSKLADLAAVIEQQQPDVLLLQEIGPDGAVPPGMLKGDGRSTDACG
jgi:hypothetical protein